MYATELISLLPIHTTILNARLVYNAFIKTTESNRNLGFLIKIYRNLTSLNT